MGIAIAAVTIGGWLAYSALKGMSLADVFKSSSGAKLNPSGSVQSNIESTASAVPSLAPGDTTGRDSSSNLQSMTNEMGRMASLNQPYKWGGGHASFDANGPWDCSGAVSYLLHFMGMLSGSPLTSTGLLRWGESGRGSQFTVYTNPTHVFIKMERGTHAGQCWGTTRSSPRGGPGWHQHTTVGFIARHHSGW